MMQQYHGVKEQAGDALLFYRMGDFYELFFDDAIVAAGVLDITLTKRGQHNGDGIPMCGVPFHAYESYLARLIKAGHKVAICEQTETPEEAKKRGAKSVVNREIVRIITPGTIVEDSLLESRANNFLASVATLRDGEETAIAWCDLSTGELYVRGVSLATIVNELAVIAPREILVGEQWLGAPWVSEIAVVSPCTPTTCAPSQFDSAAGQRRLLEAFQVATLEGFGDFSRAECGALGALLGHIELTQAGAYPALMRPKRVGNADTMVIDASTRYSLELIEAQSGGRKGSLLWAIDRTITGAGARRLTQMISAPLVCADAIAERQDGISWFVDNKVLCERLREELSGAPDIARAISRLSLGRGGPRDLVNVRQAMELGQAIATLLSAGDGLVQMPIALVSTLEAIENKSGGGFSKLKSLLERALVDEPGLLARDGGFVAKDYDAGLDKVRALRDDSRRIIAKLEGDYRDKTQVKALKIKHNNVLGYFVETPPAHGDKLMQGACAQLFVHRQTLASAVRFTTGELADLDMKISRARGEALARELEIFENLCEETLSMHEALATLGGGLAEIDCLAGLATLAMDENFVRPKIDQSHAFDIKAGRHPVVERVLADSGQSKFVPNDCVLDREDDALIWLVTGPNMAGKSTFLRQNALIAILAQAGSFVPASSAHIGVIDRIFSRVGASDDLARGRSTFMVEMVETATILNQATPKSLVVLDEIGRGTSTYDGMSIAWASIEHLHDACRCRGLFATHYHELTELSDRLARLENVSVSVREWKGDVIFVHEVAAGAADRSYGVAVAKLAGLPASVVDRAQGLLEVLESRSTGANGGSSGGLNDLPLFSAQDPVPAPTAPTNHALDRLEQIDPDALTAREALDLIYQLKAEMKD